MKHIKHYLIQVQEENMTECGIHVLEKTKNKQQNKKKKINFAEMFQMFLEKLSRKKKEGRKTKITEKGENIETEITVSILKLFMVWRKNCLKNYRWKNA